MKAATPSIRLFGLSLALACGIPTSLQAQGDGPWPAPQWTRVAPSDVGLNANLLEKARDYALRGGGSGRIIRNGKMVMHWGSQTRRYDLKSTTKSIGVTALGLAIADGKIALSDTVIQHHPKFGVPPSSNEKTGWIHRITIEQLATQTAGFEKPGGYTKLIFAPGEKWNYSDGGPNWLAECVTLAYRRDVDDLMFERVFEPLGIKRNDLTWRRNSYRKATIDGVMRREFGSGISANVEAMSRIGYLYLRGGIWQDQRILPAEFVKAVQKPRKSVLGRPVLNEKQFGQASKHYGLLWWNNADGAIPDVPRDAYWSWGLYDSFILVIPSLDIVVARAGKSWKREKNADHYAVLKPFLQPIAKAAQKQVAPGKTNSSGNERSFSPYARESNAPYRSSPIIRGVEWASPDTIIRKARGGDNWPLTWGDDDVLYTAFGDGRGFKPFTPQKLSMGLCQVHGGPKGFRGANLRSPTAERKGGGASGPKVSSLLMVDGLMYMLVRNTGNSQLAWSTNHGRTWEWSEWKFKTSFGYPAFLNFGKDYQGALDEFVYVYSHDSESAYQRADRMVLARVPKTKLRNRTAYEFFRGLSSDGQAAWTKDIRRRGAVFQDAGNCYRSSVSYNVGLRRYLWCQTGAGQDTRFRGGFAIYDAPQPWGPWTTVYYTKNWDVGPGETSCLPTKWMSADGRKVHLVFSGDDSFSVRQARLLVRE